ncbi:MAG TPA: carboxypeptidase-like regulatory domain-containing protein, partial [bacterium]|nr:carboxypeptidase-like regulatory domain-containing protein [bacterium]
MIYRLSLSGLFLLVGIFSLSAQVTFTLDGTVKDLYTGRPMPSVNVYVQEIQKGTLTDTAGYFAIKNLKKGYYTLVLTRVGYKRVTRKVQLFKDINFPIKMEEQAIVFEAQEITPGVTELS